MTKNWIVERGWERPASFVNDYWWLFAMGIGALLVLFFTRCLWFTGFCPAQLSIKNSSPYNLRITLSGNETIYIDVPGCDTCAEFQSPGPSECPSTGEVVSQDIQPGEYLLIAASSDNSENPIPYNGILSIQPKQMATECFFVTGDGFVNVDEAGLLTQSTESQPRSTETVISQQPTSTPEITSNSDLTSSDWIDYVNSDWGFSLKYPQQLGEQKLYLLETKGQVPEGPEELLLLSDAQEANIQEIHPNETMKIEIFREKPEDVLFNDWSVLMSKFAGYGQLIPTTLGSCNENVMEVQTPAYPYSYTSARFVDAGDYYYLILILSNTDNPAFPAILDSYSPQECKQ